MSFDTESGLVAAQNPSEVLAEWRGYLTLPTTATWQIGDVASDGMTVTVNGSTVLSDPGPHGAQVNPNFGGADSFSATAGKPIPITVDYYHHSVNPTVAQVYVKNLSDASNPVYLLSPAWLTRSPQTLPVGWTFNAAAQAAHWVGLADHGTSVTVFADDGSGHEFLAAGQGRYTPPPEAATDLLATAGNGQFLLRSGGYTYTFGADGALQSLVTAADDTHPAALVYKYTGSPAQLTGITDPVSNRTVTLTYGGGSCPSGTDAPAGLLCQISYWDGTATTLVYTSSGELARITNPGSVTYDFGYDSSGRLTDLRDPLSRAAIAAGVRSDCSPTASSTPTCDTQIGYDTAGRVSTVTQPAPASGAARPERLYCYGYAAAKTTSSPLTAGCQTPAVNTTSVGVVGLSPTVGYAQQVVYDNRNRIIASKDSAGLTTSYTWDAEDRPVAKIDPAGVETSTGYDSQGRPSLSYGPAPASSFQADGSPKSGLSVPKHATNYDEGLSGLAAAWYANPDLLGNPAVHTTSDLSESWTAGSSPSTGTASPSAIPDHGFSGALTGQLAMPSPGRVGFDGDGGRVYVDGQLYLDRTGGPYPSAVRGDAPVAWWRLSEPAGATVAADSADDAAGSDAGTYTAVSLGQPGPLADRDATAAAFNGTTSMVTASDTPGLEFDRTDPFSVEAWVKTTSTAQQAVVSTLGSTGSDPGWEVGISGGKLYLALLHAWPNAIDVAGSLDVADGNWHHVVATYDGSSAAAGVHFYVDGAADPGPNVVFADGLTGSTITDAPVTIGSGNGRVPFAGDLADVAVYPVLLPAAAAAAHHSAAGQTSAAVSGPVLYATPYPRAIDADTPTAFWRLDDTSGSTAVDAFGTSPGTYSAGVTLGQPGPLTADPATVAGFNGTSGTVSVPDAPALRMAAAQPFSVESWVKTASTAQQAIASKLVNASPYEGWEVGLYQGKPYLALINSYPGTAIDEVGGTVIADGTWHHLVVTYDGSGKAAGVHFFIDGHPDVAGTDYDDTLAGPTSATVPLSIGSRAGATFFWSGQLADVAVYRHALTSTAAATHYLAGEGPYPQAVDGDAPSSFWRLGETAGTVAADGAGDNPGTYTGGVTLGQPGPLAGDPTPAVALNGSTGYVALPTGYSWLANGFGVSAWIDPTAAGVWSRIAEFGTGAATNNVLFATGPTGQDLDLGLWNNGSVVGNLDVSKVLTLGVWQHVAATLAPNGNGGGTATVYLNGRSVGSATFSGMPAAVSYTQNAIGKSNWTSDAYFAGKIADVAVFGHPLTADQVAAEHTAGGTAPAAPVTQHQITVDVAQFSTGGHLDVTATTAGASFNPDYGLVTSAVDPDGKATATGYTDTGHGIGPQYGLPTAVTDDPAGLALATTTSYEPPGSGSYLRAVAKTLPGGNQTSYAYYTGTGGPSAAVCGVSAATPQGGLLSQRTDPAPASGAGDARVEQYVYDAVGRQVGVRIGTAATIGTAGWACTGYDAAGRITSQSYPAFGAAAARTVTYSYAVGGNPLVSAVTDTAASAAGQSPIAATVDLLDRVVSYTDAWGNVTSTSFDQVGRTTAVSGPAGVVGYGYDPSTGRATTTTLDGTTVSTSSYDSAGRIATVSYGNGTSTEAGYDSSGRQNAVTITDKQGASGENDTFSAAGRLADQQVFTGSAFTDANPAGANYVYDGAGRLTQADLPGVAYAYGYGPTTGCPANDAGANTNRSTATVATSGGSTTTSYCYDAADRLVSTSAIPAAQISYDTHGNTVADGGQTFGYDAADRLSRAETTGPAGTVELYQRDALDRLAARTQISPISERGAATATATAATSITVPVPTGAQTGDLLLAAVDVSGAGVPSAAGWSAVTSQTDTGHATFVLSHPVAAGDPATATFTLSLPSSAVAGIVAYHSAAGTPIDAVATAADPSAASQPLPQVTTTRDADTIVHVVGYDTAVTGNPAAGDTGRIATQGLLGGLLVADRYQDLPGPSTPASASSSSATASEAITVALAAAASTTRYGYPGETDISGFTQTASGARTSRTLTLPGGATYTADPTGTVVWAYANLHGDTITTTGPTGARTWTGYWGPYGEPASTTAGNTPGPTDQTAPGTTLGYNGNQGKITDGTITLMGARPYQTTQGRFLTIDPIDGGCANPYTYAYGDPTNHPDLSGQHACRNHHERWWNPTSWSAQTWTQIGVVVALGGIAVATGGGLVLAGAGAILASVGAETSIDAIAAAGIIGGGAAAGIGGGTGIVASAIQRNRKPCEV